MISEQTRNILAASMTRAEVAAAQELPVRFRVTRPLCVHGRRIEAGMEIEVDLRQAVELIGSRRAELVDEEDAVRIQAGVYDDMRRLNKGDRDPGAFARSWQR